MAGVELAREDFLRAGSEAGEHPPAAPRNERCAGRRRGSGSRPRNAAAKIGLDLQHQAMATERQGAGAGRQVSARRPLRRAAASCRRAPAAGSPPAGQRTETRKSRPHREGARAGRLRDGRGGAPVESQTGCATPHAGRRAAGAQGFARRGRAPRRSADGAPEAPPLPARRLDSSCRASRPPPRWRGRPGPGPDGLRAVPGRPRRSLRRGAPRPTLPSDVADPASSSTSKGLTARPERRPASGP